MERGSWTVFAEPMRKNYDANGQFVGIFKSFAAQLADANGAFDWLATNSFHITVDSYSFRDHRLAAQDIETGDLERLGVRKEDSFIQIVKRAPFESYLNIYLSQNFDKQFGKDLTAALSIQGPHLSCTIELESLVKLNDEQMISTSPPNLSWVRRSVP